MIAQLPVKTFFRTSYYQNSLVHIIKNTTLFQTGFCTVKISFDTSIYGILYGMQNNYFDPLSLLTLRISDRIRTKLIIIPIIPNASIKINHQLLILLDIFCYYK